LLAISLAKLAIIPVIVDTFDGRIIDAVVETPYKLLNTVKVSEAVTAPSRVL
jgi:hypothetical protein